MNQAIKYREMIEQVALALRPLLAEVAFVGGCTTGLLLTDTFSLEQVRHTDDVDLIIHVVGHMGWASFQERLRAQGFKDDMSCNDAPICAMKLGQLRVDFMPDDEQILGFSNRWYAEALQSAANYQLTEQIVIRLVLPAYFIATKLEAYRGRGKDDPLGSRDIEDILSLFNGRDTLVEELAQASPTLRNYVSEQFKHLLANQGFEFAVQDAARGDPGRQELIFERLSSVIEGSSR